MRRDFMRFKGKVLACLFSALFLFCLFNVQQAAFANGGVQPLVETGWLADNLKNVSVIHVASFSPQPEQDFKSKHISGAVSMSVGDVMGTLGDGSSKPDAATFEAVMNKMGINNDSHVVVYGSGKDDGLVATAYWLLKYFGHGKVSYLNGGLTKWIKEKHETTNEVKNIIPSKYKPSPNESMFATADDVLKKVGNPKTVIVDVRSSDEYKGIKSPVETKIMGHIKGAVNLDYAINMNEDGTFKSLSDLKASYEAQGVIPGKEAIVYCLGGVRAAHTVFVLKYLLGYPDVKNYVAAWGEWGNKLDTAKYPVEK